MTTPIVRTRRVFPLGPIRAAAAISVIAAHTAMNQIIHTRGAPPESLLRWHEAVEVFSDAALVMFFVLSAFVIYLPTAQAGITGGGVTSWKDMLLRRVVRVLPLYYLVVIVVWAVNNPSLPGHWQDLLLHLTMTQIYSDTYIFWTDGPTWSLAVEFHFYLVIAFAGPLAARWAAAAATPAARVRRMLVVPAVFLAVGSAWLVYATQHFAVDNWSIWYGFLGYAAMFGLGMALAVAVAAGAGLTSAWSRRALGTAGLAMLVALAVHQGAAPLGVPPSASTHLWRFVLGLAAVAILGSVVLIRGEAPRWLTWRPIAALGATSYGIYLLHEPLMRLVRWAGVVPPGEWGLPGWAISFAVVFTCAAVAGRFTHRFIEQNAHRVLDAFDRDATPRDYYAHLGVDTVDLPRERVLAAVSPQPTRTS